MKSSKDNHIMFKKYTMLTKTSAKFATLLMIYAIWGCAMGVPFDLSKDKIPTLKPDMARIFVYRTFNPLAILKPLIFKLDGKNIGDTYTSSVFYHDVMPGKHFVYMGVAEKEFSFNIEAGKTVYLRYTLVSDAVSKSNYQVTLINSKTAEIALGGLNLIKKTIRYPDEVK